MGFEYRGRPSWADDLERAGVAERVGGAGSGRVRGRARGSSPRPATPVSRTAGQLAVLAARSGRRAACPGSRVVARSRTSRRRLVGQGQRRDPAGLGQPDREVGDDRPGGRVQRMADRRHPAVELAELGGGVARAAGRSRQQRDREERRAEDPEQRSEPGDRAGSSPAGARAGRSRRRGRAAPTARCSTWTGPAAWRNVPHVVATGKTRLVTRNVISDSEDDRAGWRRRGPATAGRPGR